MVRFIESVQKHRFDGACQDICGERELPHVTDHVGEK
jgi:hypothetical protein